MARRSLRTLATVLGVAVVVPFAAPLRVGAVPVADPVAGQAAGYVISQQQADGGFDLGGVPGVETPDAVLALAATAQKSKAWDTYAARFNVGLVQAYGKSPLESVKAVVDASTGGAPDVVASTAARVLALVANPLGLSPTDFDRTSPSAPAVDLLARIDQAKQPDGTYAMGDHFDGLLYAAIGLARARPPAPAPLVGQILAAQNGDGSWDASGVAKGSSTDVVTTSLALTALKVAGANASDPSVGRGIAFLARAQRPSGAWQDSGLDDPAATAAAAIALSSLHIDVSVSSWAAPYVARSGGIQSPYAWLALQQDQATGRIRSPRDGGGITTLPSSLAVQALSRQWYLDREFSAFALKLSRTLGTPNASPGAGATNVVVDSVGPNVSIGAARATAARAVLSSDMGREAAAADLFKQTFGRTIDASGQAYWSNQLRTIPRPEMLSRLTGSAEYYRLAGGTTPSFVDGAYLTVLGRQPDAAGRAHWISRLDHGVPVASIARTLVASTEYRRIQVDAAYAELLGRKPDDAGRAYWTTKLATTRIEVLLAGIASSRELLDQL